MKPPPFDVAVADRWFGVELNNLAWDLVESTSRSAEDTERMLLAAAASAWHWLQVGSPLNHLRGQCLLSTANAAAGHSEAAVRHAEQCLALSREVGSAQTVFDRAAAHGCASRAYRLIGRIDAAREQYAAALTAISESSDPGDRRVFDALYPTV